MYYHICPYCLANLDPGENCNCRAKAEEKKKEILSMCEDGEDGQMRMRLEDMAYGAYSVERDAKDRCYSVL